MVNPDELDTAARENFDDQPHASALVTMLRLHWFIRLRWFFLFAAVSMWALERFVIYGGTADSGFVRPRGLAAVLAALGLVNLSWVGVSHLLFRKLKARPARQHGPRRRIVVFANAQVAVDLLLLTFILRYTGGVESPLAIFYLFHMAIVALLLPRWWAVLQAGWALFLYSTLVIGEWRGWLIDHYEFVPGRHVGMFSESEFVLASLLVVSCGIIGTLYFTLQIAQRLERRDRELRTAIAALKQSQVAIQDLQRRRSRFMQTAAHQLKSPLAVIQTLTDLIRCNVVPPEAVPGTCEKIVRRCQEGISQVTELLTLARVQEADPGRHSKSEAEVCKVVGGLCERLGALAQDKGLKLSFEAPKGTELVVNVDPQDLRDCIGNLIENAIKYTPGPGSVWVTVAKKPDTSDPREVSVCVRDTGIGINPKILRAEDGEAGREPVFDAFRRGDNALAAGIPGTGLGLSIVREVVEQAGGHIRVTSSPGEGSEFTVTFPIRGMERDKYQIRDTRASEVLIASPEDNAK